MTSLLNPKPGMCKLFQALIPWRFRRMLVLSGAYGLMSSMERPLREHAKELSTVMRLSKDPAFVETPMAFHSVLVSRFNDLNVEVEGYTISIKDAAQRTLTETERKALSSAMADQVSPTFRYTHASGMVQDFYSLLGFVNSKHIKPA